VSYLHHYVSGNGLYPAEAFGETDRFFLCVNLFHASGTNPVYTALRRGASLAVPAAFSTATFWADIRRMQATCGLIMSSMMSFLWQQEPQEDDADNPLRSALMGPLTPEYEQFAKRFGMENVFTSYSSTELTCPLYSGFNPTVTSSVGRVIDGFELRVVDAYDDEVPLGQVGELVARHRDPWVITAGYFGMPEATASAWRNGWYHTGDGFRTDADGHFYFVDRIKDVIRRRGENISSFEVEVALLSHEAIKEAAAIAVPSDRSEDEVMACVVLKDGADLDLVDLVDFLTPLMAYYMVPRYFAVLEELPKTPTHKIQKAQLRSIFSAADAWDREAHGLRLRREKFD
jgi:crotonobetaine/carnitine-CoA ligase